MAFEPVETFWFDMPLWNDVGEKNKSKEGVSKLELKSSKASNKGDRIWQHSILQVK